MWPLMCLLSVVSVQKDKSRMGGRYDPSSLPIAQTSKKSAQQCLRVLGSPGLGPWPGCPDRQGCLVPQEHMGCLGCRTSPKSGCAPESAHSGRASWSAHTRGSCPPSHPGHVEFPPDAAGWPRRERPPKRAMISPMHCRCPSRK